MTLFSDPHGIHDHRTRIVLAEKHVTIDIIDVDPLDPHEDVIDLNPYGTTPLLVDRNLSLYESGIIMEYLDERFPHPPLLPVDPVARAESRMLAYRVEKDWYSLANTILSGGRAAIQARKELKDSLTVSAPIFDAKPYFMSDDYSLVDASIAPLLWRLPIYGIEFVGKTAKSVNTYAANLFKREAFIASLTEFEREMRL